MKMLEFAEMAELTFYERKDYIYCWLVHHLGLILVVCNVVQCNKVFTQLALIGLSSLRGQLFFSHYTSHKEWPFMK